MTLKKDSYLVRFAYPNGVPASTGLWSFIMEVVAMLILRLIFGVVVAAALGVIGAVVLIIMYGGAPIALFFGYRPTGIYRWFTSPDGLELVNIFKRMKMRRSLYTIITGPRTFHEPGWWSFTKDRIKAKTHWISPTIVFR